MSLNNHSIFNKMDLEELAKYLLFGKNSSTLVCFYLMDNILSLYVL
jgi:hypothetical protein